MIASRSDVFNPISAALSGYRTVTFLFHFHLGWSKYCAPFPFGSSAVLMTVPSFAIPAHSPNVLESFTSVGANTMCAKSSKTSQVLPTTTLARGYHRRSVAFSASSFRSQGGKIPPPVYAARAFLWRSWEDAPTM